MPDNTNRSELARLLRERARAIAGESGDRTVLVSWEVETGWRTAADLRHGNLAHEVLQDVQPTGGAGGVWSVGIEPLLQGELPSHWYEEDTILGDFLRAVREYQNDQQPLRLQEFLDQRELDTTLHDMLQVADATERQVLLRESALLGAELLRGES